MRSDGSHAASLTRRARGMSDGRVVAGCVHRAAASRPRSGARVPRPAAPAILVGRGGVAQWQSSGLISRWSGVQISPPLPTQPWSTAVASNPPPSGPGQPWPGDPNDTPATGHPTGGAPQQGQWPPPPAAAQPVGPAGPEPVGAAGAPQPGQWPPQPHRPRQQPQGQWPQPPARPVAGTPTAGPVGPAAPAGPVAPGTAAQRPAQPQQGQWPASSRSPGPVGPAAAAGPVAGPSRSRASGASSRRRASGASSRSGQWPPQQPPPNQWAPAVGVRLGVTSTRPSTGSDYPVDVRFTPEARIGRYWGIPLASAYWLRGIAAHPALHRAGLRGHRRDAADAAHLDPGAAHRPVSRMGLRGRRWLPALGHPRRRRGCTCCPAPIRRSRVPRREGQHVRVLIDQERPIGRFWGIPILGIAHPRHHPHPALHRALAAGHPRRVPHLVRLGAGAHQRSPGGHRLHRRRRLHALVRPASVAYLLLLSGPYPPFRLD